MMSREGSNRLYNDLAWLWPLWGDMEDYRRECEVFAELIREHARGEARTLLDITCGGGKNAFHLKRHFEVTGVDISEAMLANAKKLNPDCVFHKGDMRSFDLGREFDAVFLNDGIVYMTSEEDLLKTFETAHKHLRPGGVMLAFVEYRKEDFLQNKTTASTFSSEGIEVAIVENNYDPDPEDTTLETTFVYLIRENGKLRIEHDFHKPGIFPLDTWRRLLKEAGFEMAERLQRLGKEDYPTFICIKPE